MIYTREANPLRMILPLKVADIHSTKKSVDAEILDKFPLVTNDSEKSIIQDVPLKYSYRTFSAKQNDQILQNVISGLLVDNPEIGSSSQNLQNFKTAAYSRAFPLKKTGSKPTNARISYNRKPTVQQPQMSRGSSKASEQSTPRNDVVDYSSVVSKPTTSTSTQKQAQSKPGESSMDIFNEFDSVVGNKSSGASSSSSQRQPTQKNAPADDDIFDLPAKALHISTRAICSHF